MSVLARKGQAGRVERRTALVLLQGPQWVRVAFAVPCIRPASIPRELRVHVRECRDVRGLEPLVLESAQRLGWRLRLVLQIVRRADTRSVAAEITATKSRRKVQ